MRMLELSGVSVRFGGLAAMTDLDLHLDKGEIVSVIGPNGAGKTTLFNLITGVYRPTSGEVLFEGANLVGRTPDAIARRGIARTFQTVRLFPNMTVKQNVKSATYGSTSAGLLSTVLRLPHARREERMVDQRAEELLSFFGTRLLEHRWNQPAHVLSYANRRRLEIARAMATNARLLLIDEPAAGMNPEETREIGELIGRLRDERDCTILVIEHDMHVVQTISDRVVALDHGTKVTEGSFDEVANHPAVVESYLGRTE